MGAGGPAGATGGGGDAGGVAAAVSEDCATAVAVAEAATGEGSTWGDRGWGPTIKRR